MEKIEGLTEDINSVFIFKEALKKPTNKYVGIMYSASTQIPRISYVEFDIKDYSENKRYLRIVSGGVTGYEELPIKKALEEYIEKQSFTNWVACFGTLNSWNRLEIPMIEIIRYLTENEYISVIKEYGYIKKIMWLK